MSTAPKLGPNPTLLSRKEVDALYEALQAVIDALETLGVDYIVTGGSLLGAIRQHSILFCDDDIDIAIIETGGVYEKISRKLQELLGENFQYQIRPWEGGDRIRPVRMNNVFLDLFTLQSFKTMDELKDLIGIKKNGSPQSDEYIHDIVNKVVESSYSQGENLDLCPFWHFNTRKAVEMWPKEVYRHHELFPLCRNLKMGPVTSVKGPRMPVLLLKRAFGPDCFDYYYQSVSHKASDALNSVDRSNGDLAPLTSRAGTWESGRKLALQDEHYIPMQPLSRYARRPTLHNRDQLVQYLDEQALEEARWIREEETSVSFRKNRIRPHRTVYMDGVFDLFHVGHLEAIRQCVNLGDRVVIGVTSDVDASGYKRPPIICEQERVAIVRGLEGVDEVICPCPLIVTEEFMKENGIDLVVHGFATDADAKRQEEFFAIAVKLGKFNRIPYYSGQSTTDIIRKIQCTSESSTIKCSKPQWFGSSVAAATGNAANIPYDPVPLLIRQIIEPHIRKSTKRREEALRAIRESTGPVDYEKCLTMFKEGLIREGHLSFDPSRYPLRAALVECGGMCDGTDLSRLHETIEAKENFLYSITKQSFHFQQVFDEFVRCICAPQLALIFDCDEIYYQAFPCLRVVQPGEFSIGPHCDVAYGHHPCSVNFYVPLTNIVQTSAAVFIESRPGSEDWHPILGDLGKLSGQGTFLPRLILNSMLRS